MFHACKKKTSICISKNTKISGKSNNEKKKKNIAKKIGERAKKKRFENDSDWKTKRVALLKCTFSLRNMMAERKKKMANSAKLLIREK